MPIKQAPPSALVGAEVVNANTNREDSSLTLTFSVKQWRLLAIAAVKCKPDAFIGDGAARVTELKAMASLIAEQTGKAPA